jgi:hypothetical protein
MQKFTVFAPLLILASVLLGGCSRPGQEQKSNPDPQTAGAAQPAPSQPSTAAPAAAPPAPSSPRSAAESAKTETAAPEEPAAEAPPPLIVASGTKLRVRLDSGLDTRRNQAGDRFTATLAEPVSVAGKVIFPKGAACNGHVTRSAASGRMQGRAELAITLDAIELHGRPHVIHATTIERASSGHKKRNLGLIGGGAGLGAVLGAIAGGGRGAAIGAAAGAGAGGAGAAVTGKQNAVLPAESLLTFSLRTPVSL